MDDEEARPANWVPLPHSPGGNSELLALGLPRFGRHGLFR
jgi:hypothetical protein